MRTATIERTQMTRAGILLAATVSVMSRTSFAASPEAWMAHYKEVASSCAAASGLRNARPAGDPVDFDDRVGFTAMVIEGEHPQPYMNNQRGRVLCLFDKRSRTPFVSPADTIIKERRP